MEFTNVLSRRKAHYQREFWRDVLHGLRNMSRKRCSVCNASSAAMFSSHKQDGVAHYFCSWQCSESFLVRPDLYIRRDEPIKESACQKFKKLFGHR
jgi:YHS domain-containing protein